ncbi:MAG: hypothetical protein Ct9H300mP16_08200 [Pseudomonadota bacterium]|nr:MAG: hypothetical protein Ct9H300mP16_08200 [Pseudomonadota bacterium]
MTERESDRVYSVTELRSNSGHRQGHPVLQKQRPVVATGGPGKNRIYSYRERGRLQIILQGKRLGFSLSDIGEYWPSTMPTRPSTNNSFCCWTESACAGPDLEQKKENLPTLRAELRDIRSQTLGALDFVNIKRGWSELTVQLWIEPGNMLPLGKGPLRRS